MRSSTQSEFIGSDRWAGWLLAEYEYSGLGHRTVKRVDQNSTGLLKHETLTSYNPRWQVLEEHVTDSTDPMNPVSGATTATMTMIAM